MIEHSSSLTNTITSLYTDEEVYQSLVANRLVTNLSGMNSIPSQDVQNKMIDLLRSTDQTSIVNSTIITLENIGKNTGFYIGIKDWDLLNSVVTSINHYFTDFQVMESTLFPFQSALSIFQYYVKVYQELYKEEDKLGHPIKYMLDNRKRDLLVKSLMFIINVCDPNTFNLCIKLLDLILVLYEDLIFIDMAPELFTQYKGLLPWRRAYFVRSLSNGSAKCKVLAYIISLVASPSNYLKHYSPIDQICNSLKSKPSYASFNTPLVNYSSVTFTSTGRKLSPAALKNPIAATAATTLTSTTTTTNINTTQRTSANAARKERENKSLEEQAFLSVEQASMNFPSDDEPLGPLEMFMILVNQLLQSVLSIKPLTPTEYTKLVKESETFFKMAENNKSKVENDVEFDSNLSIMKYLIESNKP